MRRIRSILVWTAIVFALLSLNPVAAKGGGSTFDFNRRWFAPGQTATGTAELYDGIEGQGRVSDGPYYGYLVPGDAFIDPPRLPRNAIRLGQVTIRRLDRNIWKASLRFVVPNVRPGTYTVSLCNVPCRSSYVGDLMGAWISIAATAEQAKMRNLEDSIVARLEERNAESTDALWAQLEELRAAVDGARPPSISVGTELRLEPIEEQLQRLSAQVRRLRERGDEGLPAWLWLAGWLVAAGMAVLWTRSTRKQRRAMKSAAPAEPSSPGDIVWNVPPPVFDERIWQPDHSTGPGELVTR